MKNFFRKTSLLLALLFALTAVLAGCGNSGSNSPAETSSVEASSAENTSESVTQAPNPYREEAAKGEVNLVLYLIGEGQTDLPQVLEEINKLMKKDINATLEIKNIPWANWDQKYQLIFNSGEEFDAAYATSWASYPQLATKGAFYEVSDDQLKTYLPNTYPGLTDEAHKYLWDKGTINGKHYLIPQTYDWLNPYVAIVRGDLREKYNIPEIKTYDDFLNYAITIGNKEKGIIPINALGNDDKLRAPLFDGYAWKKFAIFSVASDMKADDGKIFNTLERPEVLAWANKMQEVQKAGGFSKSVLSSKIDAETNFKAGTGAAAVNGFGGPLSTYMEIMKTHPEWRPEIFDIQGETGLIGGGPFDGGLAVHATSKNPLRALMMIDLLRSKKEYNDLFNCGIPGVHYTPTGEDKYTELEAGTKNYAAYNFCPWGLNTDLMRVDASYPDWVQTMRTKWASQVFHPKLEFFVFDDTKVKSEIAAIQNIEAAALPAVQFGLAKDPGKFLADLNAKEKAAGLDKVIAELQSQIDRYIAGGQ